MIMGRGIGEFAGLGIVSKFKSDGAQARFVLTMNSSYRTDDGSLKERSNWVFISMETAQKIPNGAYAHVSGVIKTRKWVNKAEVEIRIREVVARDVIVIPGGTDEIYAMDGNEPSFNRAIIQGRLGKDPEMKYLSSGQAVTGFSVAVGGKFKAKDGTEVDNTEWHDVVIFGKLGETVNQYLTKGSEVTVIGRLDTREWKDKEENARWATEVVAHEVQFGPKASGGDGERSGGGRPAQAQRNTPVSLDAEDDDEVPF
jgi:single-strand DNA-binding protein